MLAARHVQNAGERNSSDLELARIQRSHFNYAIISTRGKWSAFKENASKDIWWNFNQQVVFQGIQGILVSLPLQFVRLRGDKYVVAPESIKLSFL